MIRNIINTAYHSAETSVQKTSKPDYKVMWVCITVACCLSMIKYLGNWQFAVTFIQDLGFDSFAAYFENLMTIREETQLYRLIYWVSIVILFYCIPPFILLKWVFKEKFSEYGLSFKGAFIDYKVYLLMLCVMAPLVLFFSGTESFQSRYPFYDMKEGESVYPNLVIWELFYFVQFFALEFFFRGFMLHGTKQRFGFYSVFVMTIPYCMIHFGKPFPETISAIIAGIVLGILSLKSRSIWLGVAIHYTVAITMDLCALYMKFKV
ncbi:MAG: CPBP family glutamic-type intramembrane protease [Bacteroidota bacterium]